MKVSIVYCGKISLINGVVSVLKQTALGLIKYCEEIDFNYIYCSEGKLDFEDLNYLEKKQRNYIVPQGNIRSLLTKIKQKSIILSLIRLYQVFFFPAKNVIKLIKIYSDGNEQFIVEDYFTAYYMIKYNISNNIHFVCHSDCDLLSQLYLSYPKLKFLPISKKLNKIIQKVLNNSKSIICVSKTTFIDIKEKYKNVAYIPNGIEFNENQKNEYEIRDLKRNFRVVSIGSIGIRKGFDRIVEVALECKRYELPIKFICVGGGTEKEEIEKKASSQGLADYIRFVGYKSNVSEYLNMADLFMLLSRNEALPVSIIEAMSKSLPIIATNVGGVKDLLGDSENPFLIKEYSKHTVVNILNDIINTNKYNLEAFGKANYQRYKDEFSTEVMAKKYCEIIKKYSDFQNK